MLSSFPTIHHIRLYKTGAAFLTIFTYCNFACAEILLPDLGAKAADPFQLSSIADPMRDDGRQQADILDEQQVRRRTLGIILGSAAVVGLYGKTKWWKDGFGEFQSQDEGWFGQNTYSGGADKLGHAFTGYVGTRLSSLAFQWAGNSREDALTLGAWTTFGILAGVEVLDGFSKNWHFSKEDVVMDALGVGMGVLMEKHPKLDLLMDIRLLYWPSSEGGRQFDPFNDYSGQTYLLVLKASGIPSMRTHPWLRYLEFAVGYGTRGYPESRQERNPDAQRNIYVGLSLNLSEVLNENVFKSSSKPSRTQRVTETFLEYVQIPGTAGLIRYELPKD